MAGSKQQRGKDSWRLTYTKDKVLYRKTVRAASPAAADIELARFVVEVNDSTNARSRKSMTFAVFATERFMAQYVEVKLSAHSIANYNAYLVRILPFFGRYKLSEIDPVDVLDFSDSLRKVRRKDGKPLSPKYLRHYYEVLHTMFETAIELGLIKTNPVTKMSRTTVPKKKGPSLNAKEAKAWLLAIKRAATLELKVIVLISLYAAAGRAELAGLEWWCVDYVMNKIKIVSNAISVKGQGLILKGTKTENRRRTVTLPRWVMRIIKRYQEEQLIFRRQFGDTWQGGERVFTTTHGTPMSPNIVTKRIKTFMERYNEHAAGDAQLVPITPHGLRRTGGSIMIFNNVDIHSAAKRIGDDPKTMMDSYVNDFDPSDQEVCDKMDDVIKPMWDDDDPSSDDDSE